mmetsp:Transcript_1684/g.2503  ORF Transcript_1684/g.2503 Transcript_1684/m.2503 type:complete len:135 (-) Transcript_1684:323-727(-)|eukprot:CAMPEP_0197247010 /NCGR_PEP_ID=MMETSP1429-20130617/25482_1 /TAXON_ID=49237 /ORGANISM="Chaetoceros  sp., Strain UNC1202" /LENGTH=134 /DNA_ID=CAMNT_0042707813 /DNA_START=69 /DNA_END=473 /DNA_ORIENTATION=+
MIKPTLFALFAILLTSVNGFVTPRSNTHSLTSSPIASPITTSTSLDMGRQWNFNEGRGPFGLKQNAEIWNGRFAQMCFTVVLLQELISGKGVVKGIQEGDPFNLAMVGLTGLSLLGLTAFLAIKGKDKYIDLDL